ncbi:MAG: hypothetical protein GIKADHBN_00156 [Phycisphaerales bacterium]|nr:hypothetical protein [Phycisphaerales bacterium]
MNASNRMLIVTIACAPAIAGAHIVHFTNPAPGQPGHFDWHAPSGGDLMFLDITAAPTDQIDQWSSSTIGQTASGLPLTTNFAGGAALAVATIDEPFVLALEHGQSFHDRVFIDNGMSSAFLTTPPGTRFEAGERRYIGVLTADGRYGWIEVSRDGSSFAAFSWAYETEAGVPLAAGQVPAPGGLLVAVIPCTAILRRRRP